LMELVEMLQEVRAVAGGHLNAGQYAAIIGAVVAVVEQADVPAATHRLEEFEQRPWALRELEPVNELIADAAGTAADHVPHVELRHLVVGHVGDGVAGLAQGPDDRILFRAPLGEPEADEDLGALFALVAVVELRDAAVAQQSAEVQEAARSLRDGHGEQRL